MNLLCVDTETDGVSVTDDHIVTCFAGLMNDGGNFTQQRDWLLNFGGEIPEGAIAVHGITNEKMRAEGRTDLTAAILEIFEVIEWECYTNGTPLVLFNAAFDLSLLETERRRHIPEHPPLDFDRINVIDPHVIDRAIDKYRKGKRTLTVTAPVYGVSTEGNAHSADFDCLMTGRIALALLQKPSLKSKSLPQIHESQIHWKAEQAASLQTYFRTKASPLQPDVVIDGGWPVQGGVTA